MNKNVVCYNKNDLGAFPENLCGTDYLVALQNYIIIIIILKKEDRLTKIGLKHNF